MTDAERERDTLPPGRPSEDPTPADPLVLTEQRFRDILTEVTAQLIGTRFVELNDRMTGVEQRVGKVEAAVARSIAVRDVLPLVLSLLAMASSVVALAVR